MIHSNPSLSDKASLHQSSCLVFGVSCFVCDRFSLIHSLLDGDCDSDSSNLDELLVMEETNSLTLGDGSFLLEKQLIHGLIQNRETTERWERRKKEHEELMSNLSFYSERMKMKIFAPFGKKAMMKAELIHTNEITVSLGVGWFVKVGVKDAIEICQRRIQECDVILRKCQAERSLFESRRDVKLRSEAFGGEEIVEKFDKEEEEKWRVEHREKMRKHKKELAEVKNQIQQNPSKTEDDLWKQLDLLELQEELEDELARLGEDEDEEGDDLSEETTSDDSAEEDDDDEERSPSDQKRVRFDEDPVSEIIPPPDQEFVKEIETVKATAVKDTIIEANVTGGRVVTSSRPTSKFKKSRQGVPE